MEGTDMAQHVDTRTIHTIHIDLLDDTLERVDSGDEVEVVLHSRAGSSAPKKLTFRDIRMLQDGGGR